MRVVTYLAYFLCTVLIVIFATQNMEPVSVYLVVGAPVTVPLIVVVGLSFFVGFASAMLNVILRAAKSNNARKRRRSESYQ